MSLGQFAPVVLLAPDSAKRGPITVGERRTLHAAIRDARKAYQTNGTIPDWEPLAQAVESIHRGGL